MELVPVLLLGLLGICRGFDKELESGLKIKYISDRSETCDKAAAEGYLVDIHYVGHLENGDQFDSTYGRKQPVKFLMGAKEVIPGWEEGVLGMCAGEKRRLQVPPNLAFGVHGVGVVPAGATVTFDIELLDVNEPPPPTKYVNVFKMMDTNADGQITREELENHLKLQAEDVQDVAEKEKILEDLHTQVENIFTHEDVDKDGVISHTEFQGPKHDEAPKPPNVFKIMDGNGDQAISREELTNYLKIQAESMQGEEAKKILEEQLYLQQVEEIFNHEDSNMDGFISFNEFKGPKHDEL